MLAELYTLLFFAYQPKLSGPIRATRGMKSIRQIFVRCISTVVHTRSWYQADPFDPTSKAYRSMKIVRGYHRQVYEKLNRLDGKQIGRDELWINQERMYYVVFEIIGLMTLFPEKV